MILPAVTIVPVRFLIEKYIDMLGGGGQSPHAR